MSTNEISEVETRRAQNLKHVRVLNDKLLDFRGICLATKDLAYFGVRISRLDLHSDQNTVADPEQQFFAPQPVESFVELPQNEKPNPEIYADGGHKNSLGLDLERDLHSHLKDGSRFEKHATWSIMWPDNFEYENSGEIIYNSSFEWRLSAVFDTIPKLRDKPHMMFTVIHDHSVDENSDNSVIRGEIISAVAMMKWIMRRAAFKEHELFPVLIVSIWRDKVRIVQVHFDGQHVHMALSDFLDFKDYAQASWNMLTRWVLNTPIGNTRVPTKSPPSSSNRKEPIEP
ncbi:hypothetical protein EMCG_06165 [[Emmonsia] crescens]|uniref:Fungal-type protein kinase domain-containing protein n=1 Tax=[Emmonsia] crescens TaxID=73230 RepID=A0A0G2J734_9EURO|nr:hypothetical protein EMCG_06165 [Emmonsia crescens UAMH 3008]